MSFRLMISCLLLVAAAYPAAARDLIVGQEAPAIEATDIEGKPFDLEAMRGKFVVLEWTNPKCPFVRKHYDTGNMQKLQQYAKNNEIVWVSIDSSAKGEQGNVTPDEMRKQIATDFSQAATVILDEDGAIGHAYGAKTTPHMFLIDKEGKLAYHGAIDSIASADPLDIGKAEHYVYDAMTQAVEGESIQFTTSKPYGCSVKYAPEE